MSTEPTEHTDPLELAMFVRGELTGARLDSFEAHVAACQPCARRLTGEARLEVALAELGPSLASAPPLARRRRARWVPPVVALAAAAAVLLVVVLRDRAPAPRAANIRSIPGVVCGDGPAQAECVTNAHRHGLFVAYPPSAGQPFGGTTLAPGSNGSNGPTTSPLPGS